MALFLFSPRSLQASLASKSETYQDIIEKAQNLILQKDRPQALLILNKAIQKETKVSIVLELRQAASEIAHKFLSDKAQQLYESSVASRRVDLNIAQQNAAEALKIEPDNLSIIAEYSRVLFAKGDCRNAEEFAIKGLQLLDADEELRLIYAQALSCQKRWGDVQKVLEKHVRKKSEYSLFWIALEVERQISLKSFNKAQEQLLAMGKIDEKYPEMSRLSWRLSVEQRKKRPADAQRYLMTCRNISANQYRQYMMDPGLCRQIAEVEKEIKRLNGSPD